MTASASGQRAQHAHLSLLTLLLCFHCRRGGRPGATFPVGREKFLSTRGALGEPGGAGEQDCSSPSTLSWNLQTIPGSHPSSLLSPGINSNGDPCDVLAESSLCLTTLILMATHFTDVKTETQGGEAMPPRSYSQWVTDQV